MFHEVRDAIRLLVQLLEELIIANLLNRLVRERSQRTELVPERSNDFVR